MSDIKWIPLDKIDTTICKGIAILFIATHNFMHRFPNPKQKEFFFDEGSFESYLYIIKHDSLNSIQATLSYFGHFGVQLFIFLSAYGLTKKYINNPPSYKEFIISRVFKIYPSFLLAILAWAIITGWFVGIINNNGEVISTNGYGILGPIKMLYWHLHEIALKLLLVSNFIPGQVFRPVGPWWFISFIFQFYIIFPFYYNIYTKYGAKSILLTSLISLLIIAAIDGEIARVNILSTVFGHFPEISLGMYLAKEENRELSFPWIFILISGALFLAGNLYKILWFGTHITFLVLMLSVLQKAISSIKIRQSFYNPIAFVGGISMQIFLVNGFLRHPFIDWAKLYNHWALTLLFCALSLATSIIVAVVIYKIEYILRSTLTKKLK